MKEVKNRHSIDIFFVLCLFLMCTISLLGLLFMGAKTYQRINRYTEDNLSMRTSLLYLSNKAKSFQEEGGIHFSHKEGADILVFEEKISGTVYATQVYFYDGHLMELFSEKDCDIGLDGGTIITKLSSFAIKEIDDALIEVSVVSPKGKSGVLLIPIE